MPPTFDYVTLKKRVRALALLVAPGLGGSPSASIKEWFLEDGDVSRYAVRIANDLAAGRVSEGTGPTIRSCRGCAVPKPGGSRRPFGIGESLVRFVGGCVLQRVPSAAHRYCLPYNLGIGVDSGRELTFCIVEMKLDRRRRRGELRGRGVRL